MSVLKSILALLFFCAAAYACANPIVWLHGWNSSGGIWKKFQFQIVSSELASASDFLTADYYGVENGFSLDTPIEEIAEAVACDIQDFYDERTEKAPLDVVCHSMGGLVFRTLVANECLVDNAIVRRYVTLGTPHYGQAFGLTYQARQMQYGSKFLWQLGEAWQFKGKNWPSADTLCIAGMTDATWFNPAPVAPDGSYWDGLVHAWSASLGNGVPVRYVYRSHASGMPYKAPSLCELVDGKKDAVYCLVAEYLASGTIPTSLTPKYGGAHDQGIKAWVQAEQAVGAVFLQVRSTLDDQPLKYDKPDFVESCCSENAKAEGLVPAYYGTGCEGGCENGIAQLWGNFRADGQYVLTIKQPDGKTYKVGDRVSPAPGSCRFLKIQGAWPRTMSSPPEHTDDHNL